MSRLGRWSISTRRAAAAPALALAAALAACASPPPPVPPTVADLKITASPAVNPTQTGQAAPVIIRVYQLSSTAAFDKAEFFRLFNADTTTLGSDLVKKDEYLLAPGATKEASLTLPDTVKALGVMAAFREFGGVTWRVDVPVPPHKTTAIAITAGAGLAVTSP